MLSNELTSSLFTMLTMTDYFLAASVFILEIFLAAARLQLSNSGNISNPNPE